MLDAIQRGLATLTPQELQELDVLITPRLAQLLAKVMPDLGPMLAPFAQPGGGGQPMPQQQPQRPVPMPQMAVPGGGRGPLSSISSMR